MLTTENAVLVIVDVQGKLASLMYDRDNLYRNLRNVIEGAKVIGIPIIWNEQLPDKLGKTVPEVAESLQGMQPLVKNTFSCCGNDAFMQKLQSLNRRKILLAGIETHVCVYQTTMDLLKADYDVHILADATSSRFEKNYKIALKRMRQEGAKLTVVEMALFEILKVAEGEKFKQIIKIVK